MRSAFAAIAVLSALAAPAGAGAGTSFVAVPGVAPGTTVKVPAPRRFDLVGVHWRGPGVVQLRTRSTAGRWSAWRVAAPEPDLPDAGGREHGRVGWRVGNPWWAGPSNRLQVRARGRVTALRAYFVRSKPSPAPLRTLSAAGAPPIIRRTAWGANEAIRRDNPEYASGVRYSVIHHTAGTNSYSRAQSAAIVRGIMEYHVRGNGWDDIGYNFLVDRYGQVFEGRFGGITRPVVGAHAGGFNTGSVGVAVIGSYGSTGITAAARTALVRLVAWRLDVAHVDPLSVVTAVSAGNERFAKGAPVPLRAVSGHRDTGLTSCPGNALYALLGSLADEIDLAGGPKIYAPSVAGVAGGATGPVRFTASLSDLLSWTVTVTDSEGIVTASGSGDGNFVDWTWDASVAAGTYRYAISAPGARPVTGTLRARGASLSITQLRATPLAVTPNADGRGDAATISYVLGAAATVTAQLQDAEGRLLATLFSTPQAAGKRSFRFTADAVPDGNYDIVLTAADTRGREVRAAITILVSRALSGLVASREAISPNADGAGDSVAVRFTLAAPVQARLRVLLKGVWAATPFTGPLAAGPQALVWNGRRGASRLRDGRYELELQVTDAVGTVTQKLPLTLDTVKPRVRFVSLRPLRFAVNEPGQLVVTADTRRAVIAAPAAGTYTVPLTVIRTLRAFARDRAGNRSVVLSSRR
jgi:hypothetical protein